MASNMSVKGGIAAAVASLLPLLSISAHAHQGAAAGAHGGGGTPHAAAHAPVSQPAHQSAMPHGAMQHHEGFHAAEHHEGGFEHHGGGFEHHEGGFEHHEHGFEHGAGRFHDRDPRHFSHEEIAVWRGGHWHQGWHNGRFGWWWGVEGAWYYYPQPLYPFPLLVPAVVVVGG